MIIYILYYLDHKANNCVHCNTVWQDTILEIKPEQQNYQNNMEILVKFNYCSCHDEQVKREDAKFYFSCG